MSAPRNHSGSHAGADPVAAASQHGLGQAGSSAERGLVRAIGVRGLTASIVNATVGAGIFVLPAIVAGQLGTAAPLAYSACALVMTLVVASFAVAGTRVSLTGGIYAYVEVAFGPFVGFLTGVLIYVAVLLAGASVASAMASSVGLVMPGAGAGIGKALVLAAVYTVFVTMNARGVALGTRLVEGMTVAKLLPLALLIVAGMRFVRPETLHVTVVPPSEIAAASLTLIFAFVGIEVALVPSGEIREPSRTIPRAVFLALGLTTLLYLALQLVAHATLGADLARFTDAPLAEAAARALGPWGRVLMLTGGTVSMLGYLSGDALATPRMLFAFARDGFLPAPLARVHPRFHTPTLALAAHAALVWTVAVTGSFATLAVLSNVAILSVHLLCCAAAIELRRRDVRTGGTPFVVPGGPLVPMAACVAVGWLLWQASSREWAVLAATVAGAAALYALRMLRRTWRK